MIFVPCDLKSLSTIQVQVITWLSEHHLSEKPGLEGPLEDPEFGYLDAYVADVEGGASGFFWT